MALDLLEQTLPHIKNHIYPKRFPLVEWKVKEGEIPGAEAPRFDDKRWRAANLPIPWGGFDKTVWFRNSTTLPADFSGLTVVLLLNFPQALVFVNGKPLQGVDGNHSEVLLTTKARAHQPFSIAIEAQSGRTLTPQSFALADLAIVNPTARTLYYGLKALREIEQLFGPGTAESKEVRELIRRTLIFVKYFSPEGEEYPNAIGRAWNFLKQAVESEMSTSIPGLVHLVGHTHIDVAWLWTLRETRKKVGRTFSGMIQLLQELPDFKFAQDQAQLYDFAKQDYPDLFNSVKKLVQENRWEILGGMWVEPDCQLPSGESLVRQILYGKRFFMKEFGVEPKIAWLPDSFGFTWSLPQLLVKSGFDYFFTTKMLWNDTTKFPYNTFWWQGLDKSKILTHLPAVGIEGLFQAKDIKKSWDQFHQKETAQDVMLAHGSGDGGGGPTKEQLELAPLLRKLPGLPRTTMSRAAEFFQQAQERTQEIPTWNGELYLEKHRGIFTTHGRVKRANRECEVALGNAELLACLATLVRESTSYPAATLDQAWKSLLRNQFHDILAGTSVADVYEEAHASFNDIREACQSVVSRSLDVITDRPPKRGKTTYATIFNPLPWERSEYVEVSFGSNEKSFIVKDDRGNEVEHQQVERSGKSVTLLCYLPRVAPFSTVTLTIDAGSPSELSTDRWRIRPRHVESPFFRIRLDHKGGISSFYDRQVRREFIKKGSRANVLQTYSDKPKQWEAWELEADNASRSLHLLKLKSVKVVEQGPLRVVVRLEHRTPNNSRITQDLILYHALRRVDFVTHARWFERQTLLKAAFPLDIRSSLPVYEIQFGAITRTSRPTTPQDKAKFEVPALRWADLSDSKSGVSLLNDSKYGYDARENTLRLTLLRSPHYPHPVDPARLVDNRWTDQGDHVFTYALLPHAGDWRKGETVRRAREFNNPLIVVPGRIGKQIPALVTSPHGNIQIDSVKKAEDSERVIVRAYEAHGEARTAKLVFGFGVKEAYECDLMENDRQKLKHTKSSLTLKFKPYEVKTIKVALKPGLPKR